LQLSIKKYLEEDDVVLIIKINGILVGYGMKKRTANNNFLHQKGMASIPQLCAGFVLLAPGRLFIAHQSYRKLLNFPHCTEFAVALFELLRIIFQFCGKHLIFEPRMSYFQ
jgi:hypothetical protein